MRISRISVYQLDLPLKEPYFLSGGRLRFDALDSTFVRIETDEGLIGWGEGCPWGNTYLPAHGPGIRAGIETLAPVLIGQDPRNLDHINRVMDEHLPGHEYVKSALDVACWDILGLATNMPLWQLLGGASAEPVGLNSSISTGTPDEMIALIKTARSFGYRTHSAKIGGVDPSLDIARIEAINAELEDQEMVTYDVNRAWEPSTALQVLNSVQGSKFWIEQPCQTLDQCAFVSKHTNAPIILDECLHSFQDHLDAWRLNSFVGLKIKPNRVGGLTKAKKIRDLSVSIGWRMHIEDVGGSALADTAAIHLASATPEQFRLDSWLCHYHLEIDPCPNQGARNQNGKAYPPSAPGLGVQPDMTILGKEEAVYT